MNEVCAHGGAYINVVFCALCRLSRDVVIASCSDVLPRGVRQARNLNFMFLEVAHKPLSCATKSYSIPLSHTFSRVVILV